MALQARPQVLDRQVRLVRRLEGRSSSSSRRLCLRTWDCRIAGRRDRRGSPGGRDRRAHQVRLVLERDLVVALVVAGRNDVGLEETEG